jgi:surfeit locus 1 family protein
MKLRDAMLGVVALVSAAGCIRLGFWQLDRLKQRRTKNALIVGQTALAPLSAGEARMQDTTSLHWRRLNFQGVPDYAHEVVLASRSQDGTVGVQVVTPVRPTSGAWGDTSVLVIRGFMPAPDGRKYTRGSTSEGETLNVQGLVTELAPAGKGAVRMPSAPQAFRWINRDTLSKDMSTALAPFLLLQLGDTVQHDVSKITRVPPPSLDEGPHKSYAVQWFAFATVAMVGYGAYLYQLQKAPKPPLPRA